MEKVHIERNVQLCFVISVRKRRNADDTTAGGADGTSYWKLLLEQLVLLVCKNSWWSCQCSLYVRTAGGAASAPCVSEELVDLPVLHVRIAGGAATAPCRNGLRSCQCSTEERSR